MKAFRKLLISDSKQFFRERAPVFFTFAFPLLLMLIFGVIFGASRNVSYKISLIDEDASIVSGEISEAIQQIPVFETTEGTFDNELAKLKKGDIQALVVIPAGTQSIVSAGKTANITVYYNPSQLSSSEIILSVLRQATNDINQQLTHAPILVQLNQQPIQPPQRLMDFLVPGILAMTILLLGLLFSSLTLVERRERKILKRFRATPISRSTIIYSQVVLRLILAVLAALIIIVFAHFVFKVSIIDNWGVLLGLILLGTLTFISIGYLLVSWARTVQQAFLVQIIMYPMLYLSGIFFPVVNMPGFMRPVVNAIPLTYLGDALQQVMVGGTPLFPLGMDVAVLGGWLIACMALAIRFFRWE
jgi:ABC-2 type transport system permease protein